MPSSKIALLTPDGPNGKLERRPARMDRQESREVPVQNGYRWIDDPGYGVVMSVWDSTPCTSKMLPFFQHEFMMVLDGSVTIVEPDGRETTVRAGGCFIFPRGCVRQWKQTEYFSQVRGGFQRRYMAGAGQPRRPTVGAGRPQWASGSLGRPAGGVAPRPNTGPA
jgi:uncharacterized cupin superfamily protein